MTQYTAYTEKAIQKARRNPTKAAEIDKAIQQGLDPIAIKDLKNGEFFTYHPDEEPDEKKVYIRGEYDRSTRKYTISKWSDFCADCTERAGDYIVFTGFTF